MAVLEDQEQRHREFGENISHPLSQTCRPDPPASLLIDSGFFNFFLLHLRVFHSLLERNPLGRGRCDQPALGS